ncbi:MAG TPA: hypothetical protein PK036_16815, partial [Geobacteraceae bacterium]|nr:hypothetical protein [Geobacteraceae bacterium]
LYLFHMLYLPQFFLYNYFILVFLIAVLALIIGKHVSLTRDKITLSLKFIKKYGGTFFDYSHPIFIIALVALVEGLFGRWLLQYYGGSIEQGFYSLSYQIGAICFLFTGAMTPLLMREYSILHGTGNIGEMRRLFERYVPMLFTIAAFFSCFIMVQAKSVVRIIGGEAFQGGILAVAIMALYPIHQTYGQLTSSLFYATGRTRLYRNIAVFFSLVGVPTTYFMIAPPDKFGLNAGATGLAAKMVIINIIAVNVQLYFNTRLLNLNYRRFLLHQALCMSILVGLAYIVSGAVSHFIGHPVAGVPLSGVFYSAAVFGITCLKPEIFGFRKQDLLQAAKRLSDFVKKPTSK